MHAPEYKTVAFMVHATIKNKKYIADSGAIKELDNIVTIKMIARFCI